MRKAQIHLVGRLKCFFFGYIGMLYANMLNIYLLSSGTDFSRARILQRMKLIFTRILHFVTIVRTWIHPIQNPTILPLTYKHEDLVPKYSNNAIFLTFDILWLQNPTLNWKLEAFWVIITSRCPFTPSDKVCTKHRDAMPMTRSAGTKHTIQSHLLHSWYSESNKWVRFNKLTRSTATETSSVRSWREGTIPLVNKMSESVATIFRIE